MVSSLAAGDCVGHIRNEGNYSNFPVQMMLQQGGVKIWRPRQASVVFFYVMQTLTYTSRCMSVLESGIMFLWTSAETPRRTRRKRLDEYRIRGNYGCDHCASNSADIVLFQAEQAVGTGDVQREEQVVVERLWISMTPGASM